VKATKQQPTCSARLADRSKCQAIALLGKRFCHFHHISNARRKPVRRRLPPVPYVYQIPIPPLSDQHSIAEVRTRVEKAMVAGLIDPQRGKLLLHAFQIAATNLRVNIEGN
jgi:hypothetical protein